MSKFPPFYTACFSFIFLCIGFIPLANATYIFADLGTLSENNRSASLLLRIYPDSTTPHEFARESLWIGFQTNERDSVFCQFWAGNCANATGFNNLQSIAESFAPAQFIAMIDAEKLSQASFEPSGSGITLGNTSIRFNGMPCCRWWSFELASPDFGSLGSNGLIQFNGGYADISVTSSNYRNYYDATISALTGMAAPIPEPATFTLLLTGLGLISITTRGRKSFDSNPLYSSN